MRQSQFLDDVCAIAADHYQAKNLDLPVYRLACNGDEAYLIKKIILFFFVFTAIENFASFCQWDCERMVGFSV